MSGRPCTVCANPQRSQVEDGISAGEPIAAIASAHGLSRTSIRRHRDRHMAAALTLRDDGISPWRTVLRIVSTADRLHHLADQAEERGRITDATRATLAEAKTLRELLALGLKGEDQLAYAEDADALERAVGVLVRRAPAAGDALAAELESQGRDALAAAVRSLADRVRQQTTIEGDLQ